MEKEPTFINNENQAETLEPILASIMTAEEYSQIEHETPYVFELRAGDKERHYFGSRHSRNPEDTLLAEIEQAFNGSNPDIVFVEGISARGDVDKFNERVKEASREEIIDHMGEPGFTLKLAVEKGSRKGYPRVDLNPRVDLAGRHGEVDTGAK